MCISTGVVANEKVTKHMLRAKTLEAAISRYSTGGTESCMFFRSNQKTDVGHLCQHEESESM